MVAGATAAIRSIVENGVPTFGICLGHQLLSRAFDGHTFKLPFGHHGGNHPVRNLATGSVEITSQNHNFCVDADSLSGVADITHVNLNDNTNEGMRLRKHNAFSVQYHPEAGPGPHDSRYLFAQFAEMMEGK
jgi:carbamoyl-phosphate synthase small subunit